MQEQIGAIIYMLKMDFKDGGGNKRVASESDGEFLDASDILHEDTYCYPDCSFQTDGTILIGGGRKSCPIQWYHMQCIGLTTETVPGEGVPHAMHWPYHRDSAWRRGRGSTV